MMPGFLELPGENFDLGPEQGLITWSFCVAKISLSINGIEKASDIGLPEGGKKNILSCQFLARHLILVSKLLIIDKKKHFKSERLHQVSTTYISATRGGSPDEVSLE